MRFPKTKVVRLKKCSSFQSSPFWNVPTAQPAVVAQAQDAAAIGTASVDLVN
jgi:hypothetical protein